MKCLFFVIKLFVLVHCRGVAQLVEQWSPKPCVVGSSPATPANQLDFS